eukprot:GFKZ01004706.1.p2 GENE.GFKZ01004706.1~~GFKZ01004706.1.p2  ORF type:complete len:554 (+),score=87.48 GFKZ01004706.1:432-2093(+)
MHRQIFTRTRFIRTLATTASQSALPTPPNAPPNSAYNFRRAAAVAGAAAAAAAVALGVNADRTNPAFAYASVLLDKPTTAEELARAAFKPPLTKQYPGVYNDLIAKLGEDRVTLDDDELEQRGKEASGYATPSNPQVVVFPETTQHVSDIMAIAHAKNVPVVPYAAGTSLEGHTVAVRGGICIDMKNMAEVLAINKADMDCIVQPGVQWMELNEVARPYGMFLGVDPAPGACIGGMCGTCCSGTNAVRYGTMKDQVLNLTVVLADGSVVKTGQRARKSSAGYDLARLFVGSEGTLGIVTEATLRLRNIPETMSMARVTFPSVHAACSAVIEILQKGVMLGAIEIMDEEMVKAVNKYSGTDFPMKPTILFKFTGTESHVQDDIRVVKEITKRHTNEGYHFAQTAEESAEIWGARKHAFWAAQMYEDGKELMATDVAVPISKLADCITETKKELDESFLFCPIVGHVGDGNFHTVIAFDPTDPREDHEAHRLNSLMVHRAIEMDGTCTGEHGVGIGKKEYLIPEMGENAVELMKTVKRALDPKNILNPGKIIDIE